MRLVLVPAVSFLVLAMACTKTKDPTPDPGTQVPAVPTDLAATPGNQTITLAWNPSGTATTYNLKRAPVGGQFALIAATGTAGYTDNGLVNGTTYRYVVSAVNQAGESADCAEISSAPVAPATPPATPTGLTATPGNNQAVLSWTASNNATGYHLKRAAVGGSFTTINSPATPGYTDGGVVNGTLYRYTVSAFNQTGESSDTAEVTCQPAAPVTPPAAPTGLAAVAGDKQIVLNWAATATATSYHVKRAPLGGAFTTLASPTAHTFMDTGLTNGTTYRYHVSALNAAGEGLDSSEVSGVPFASSVTPTGLLAIPGNRQVTLTWTAATGATSYRVKRWTQGSEFIVIASPTATTYTDTGLINGTAYRYIVSAINSSGETAGTPEVTGDLGAQPAIFSDAASPDWVEDFNLTNGSLPDSSKWSYNLGNNGGWGNGESETYTDTNAYIQNGNLEITAMQPTAGTYTSARMVTENKFTQQYGRIVARVQMPGGQGIWPAFWMLGSDIGSAGWPACGEIDIMENIGREPSVNHGSLHGPGYSGGADLTSSYTLPSGVFTAGFHTFRIDWVENLIQFYVDDYLYEIRSAADVVGKGNWAFNHPFYFIVNIAVGGGWPGYPDGSTVFPQTMRVDYVHVYNLK